MIGIPAKGRGLIGTVVRWVADGLVNGVERLGLRSPPVPSCPVIGTPQ